MTTTETLQQTSTQESVVPDYPDLITIATGESITTDELCDRLSRIDDDTPEGAQKAWQLTGAQNVVRAICLAQGIRYDDSLKVDDIMARDRAYRVRGSDGDWQTKGSMMVAFTTRAEGGEMAQYSFTVDEKHPSLPEWTSRVLGKMAFAERLRGNHSFLTGSAFNPSPVLTESERRKRLFRDDS